LADCGADWGGLKLGNDGCGDFQRDGDVFRCKIVGYLCDVCSLKVACWTQLDSK